MDKQHLTLSASLAELRRLSDAVAEFCRANGVGEKSCYTLQLACDEWVTNVIVHGYGKDKPESPDSRPIEVTLERAGGTSLRLVFEDEAPAFDPLALPEPDVTLPMEEREIGGLGVHFLRTMMDECRYERVDGRNRLILIKKLRESQEGGGQQ